MTFDTNQEPFHYLNNLREFLGGEVEPQPLGPWLASLAAGDLNYLTDAIDEYTRGNGEMPEHLLSDVMAVVVQTIALEKNPAPSFSCSIDQLHQYVFALGLCCAIEQMRRAGLARVLSPMLLTSDHTPKLELVSEP